MAGIYASKGQLYEPVDAGTLMYYKEAKDGQVLEEGINEAGAISSFIAAGTAYSNLGINMMPFYIYYSMFGFQRVGDLIWLAADSRTKGFLVGGTAGRTTLNGEGLQHEDGHSHLIATTVHNLMAYDPAYAYELAVIIQDGLGGCSPRARRFSITSPSITKPIRSPRIPDNGDVTRGILKGMYRLKSSDAGNTEQKLRPQLFGSGTILREVEKAQAILADKYGVASDLWSVTSYTELCRDAQAAARWNRLHPGEEPRKSYLEELFAGQEGPFVASSDNVRLVADQIRQYLPGPYTTLGTDGFGRSDTREALRRHFEIDASPRRLRSTRSSRPPRPIRQSPFAGSPPRVRHRPRSSGPGDGGKIISKTDEFLSPRAKLQLEKSTGRSKDALSQRLIGPNRTGWNELVPGTRSPYAIFM